MQPLVFFGSGPVAAKSLELLAKDFEIEAVVTKAGKHKRDAVPVLDLASKLGTNIFTLANKQQLDELIASNPFDSELGVIIDYGIIVSRKVIDSFGLGIVNSHFSLLPQWRGADPISFAILSGQQTTGVSLMLINEKMDEGLLLAQDELAIAAKETTPSLTEKLIGLSNRLLASNLPKYTAGKLKPYPQDESGTSYSSKLTKQDGIIDWQKPAAQLEREVRAYLDWPKSRTRFGDMEVIISDTDVVNTPLKPGEIKVSSEQLLIGTGQKSLAIQRLKPAGKNEMSASEFIRGYKSRIGSAAG